MEHYLFSSSMFNIELSVIQAFEIVQILMSNEKKKGIDVNPVDLGGYTPADCAYECGNVELLQFFKDV